MALPTDIMKYNQRGTGGQAAPYGRDERSGNEAVYDKTGQVEPLSPPSRITLSEVAVGGAVGKLVVRL